MKISLAGPIDRRLWLRYLQAGAEADDQLEAQLVRAEKLLLDTAQPRAVYRVTDLAALPVEGASVRRHLAGCVRAAVMAVTIGSGIDELIKRTQITSMPDAVILDTGASVLAEQAADEAERILKEELAEKLPDMYATSRFSPGYGDYPVACQREVLNLADAPRRIGLTVTASDMMVPHKSVTAVIGLADHPVTGRFAPCSECLLYEKCDLRTKGKHC